MRTQSVFRGCSHSLKGIRMYAIAFRGVFNNHSKVFTHSIAFRGWSILTQRCSSALNCIQGLFNSHTNMFFLMVTSRWVAFSNNSLAFMHTQWVFRGCSILAQSHSRKLISIQGCSTLTHRHSHTFTCVQWVFNSPSQVSTRTQLHSGAVQFWHKCDLSRGHTTVSCIQ